LTGGEFFSRFLDRPGGLAEYDFAKFCETAERVMARREKPLTPAIRAMLEYVFYQTKPRRLGLLR